MAFRASSFCGQQGVQIGIHKPGVVSSPDKVGVVQNLVEQIDVVGGALNDQLLQGPAHPPDGLQPGGGVDDDLGHHGVVVGGQVVAAVQAAVHPHPAAAGHVEEVHMSGGGPEVMVGVLGVDAALNGVAMELHLVLGHRQGQPGGHPNLLPHQVQPGDHLGDRVLHLDTGVHLYEVKLSQWYRR